ncbi:divalent-cation tolerance protein CutA [Arcobacter sp.]|uniref:divalent-cation tolerance protein CutA n=1 Tax=Arcobacter sp. TaxID=1872629 RepID=UPI003D130599
MKLCIVQTTCKDMEEAKNIAKTLLNKKLAACIQISDIESLYTWNNELCEDKEKLLSIKTKKKNFKKIQREIKENHSYDLPEIISIDIENVSKEYKNFIGENTK